MAEHAQAQFPILVDSGQSIARKYGVYNLPNDGVAAPATFIIGNDSAIIWYQIGENIADRPAPKELLTRTFGKVNQ